MAQVRKAMSDQRVLDLLRYGWLDGLNGAPMEVHLKYGKGDIQEALRALEESGLAQVDDASMARSLQAAADQGLLRNYEAQLATAGPYDRGQLMLLHGDPDVLQVY